MGQCTLHHIPHRLHWNSRSTVEEFYKGEKLFRRTPDASDPEPFTVSLYDLSVNREGPLEGVISNRQDVLLNAMSDIPTNYHEDIITLEVKQPDPTLKTYLYNDVTLPYSMSLLHDPIDCNFYHSIFRIYYVDENSIQQIVTKSNYHQTLGHKKDKEIKKLRGRIRQQLSNMIYREEVILNS